MKKKIIGIFICMLLISTVVLPVSGNSLEKTPSNIPDVTTYIAETKVKPDVSPSGIDVYYDCEIQTPGPIWGVALLFPGYFRSLKPDVIPTHEADGILLCGIFNDEHDDLTLDNNTYLQNDWTIMIISNFTGLMDNWGKLQNRFLIDGFASKVVVYDLNPFN